MRRKRRKQSITENRRKWRKIKENQYFQGVLRNDKNIINLPRQDCGNAVKLVLYGAKWGRFLHL